MANLSLNFHRKFFRLFFFFLLAACVFISGIDITLTLVLNKKLRDFERSFAESGDHTISFKTTYFNFFQGLVITGLEFKRGQTRVFQTRHLDVGFDLLSLAQRKVLVKSISVRKSYLDLYHSRELFSFLRDVLSRANKTIGFFETTYFKGTDLWFNEAAQVDMRGYVSFIQGHLLISRGEFLLKKIHLASLPGTDVFKGSSVYMPFDYVFEAEPQEEDLLLSRFEFSNPHLKCAGSGRIEHYLKQPSIQLEMNVMNLIFDDFPFLSNDHLQTQGVVDATLKVVGPPADLKTMLKVKVTNARFAFFDSIFLKDVNGSFLIFRDHLTGQGIHLNINGIPFSSDVAIYQKEYPHLLLSLSSLSASGQMPVFVLALSADWAKSELAGGAKAVIRYASKDTTNTIDLNLKDFHLGYEDDLYIDTRDLDADLSVAFRSNDAQGEAKIFKKDLTFENLFFIIKKEKDGFSLDEVRSDCYGGTLEAGFHFMTLRDQPILKGEAHVRGVNLQELFGKSDQNSFSLSGKLDADLRLDNSLSNMFKGQVFVNDGIVERNPILNSVANFLGVDSLRKIAFTDLSMFFDGGKGEYAAQIKLQAPQVSAFLDGQISSYEKMDGYLSVTMATELLNESKVFKRLLAYIKNDEPVIVFPFKISSYMNSPRILWLKNEFKEKLQNLLPERNKRSLQGEMNNMVAKIKEE
jgi:hypothetical protein